MSNLPKAHRWTREQYERVGRLGGFAPDQRLELIDGEIVDRSPQSEPHAVALCLLHEALRRAYGDGYVVRIQSRLALDAASAPEPDLAVVPGEPRDFLASHPSYAVLLVEIADTTLAYDRSTKRALYAGMRSPNTGSPTSSRACSRSTATRKARSILSTVS